MAATFNLRKLDVFSEEPSRLTYEDPKDPKTRGLWKTSFGGFVTVSFVGIVVSYMLTNILTIDSGDSNTIEDITRVTNLYVNKSFSLEDMKVMPVVLLNYESVHTYIDPHTLSAQRNIFVALLEDS